MFGAAAGAQVHSDYVKARAERFLRDAQHVGRLARAFNAMPNYHRRMSTAIFLPATVGQHFYIWRGLKDSLLIAHCLELAPAGPRECGKSLRVAAGEDLVRLERRCRKRLRYAREKAAYLCHRNDHLIELLNHINREINRKSWNANQLSLAQ